ncbi:MAG: amino acid permease [Pseudomonadales bacterium]|nr:amino acid permease [Pseudomonadales bacterium]
MQSPNKSYRFSPAAAVSVVVANMIGTGVFTSLGFQLLDINSASTVILLWLLGGVLALCGALCYAELGAALPRSGGEYNYLSRIYHPGLGFVSGWVSMTIGFAAPTALAAMTAGRYLAVAVPAVPSMLTAVAMVVLATLFHTRSRRGSAYFQQIFTVLKVILIVGFVVSIAWVVPEPVANEWAMDLSVLGTGGFAVAMIFVNYAYTGWNAATYIAGEVSEPKRTLPWILLSGTVAVTMLYVLLHFAFLLSTPTEAMVGQLEIGYIVAGQVFGVEGGRIISVVLAFLLLSTVSAMVLAGPRALQMIGQDIAALKFLAKENAHGIPTVAVAIQSALTIALVMTASFDTVLVFSGSVLALNTLFAVVGVVVLRFKEPDLVRPFRVPVYPLPVLVFTSITIWTLFYLVFERPTEIVFALVVIASGWLFYWLSHARVRVQNSDQNEDQHGT